MNVFQAHVACTWHPSTATITRPPLAHWRRTRAIKTVGQNSGERFYICSTFKNDLEDVHCFTSWSQNSIKIIQRAQLSYLKISPVIPHHYPPVST
jgi:hypothetical protein